MLRKQTTLYVFVVFICTHFQLESFKFINRKNFAYISADIQIYC